MNVLLVVPWDQASGGVASVVQNLARRLQARGHTIVFLHPGPPDRPRARVSASGFPGYEVKLRAPLVQAQPVKSAVAFIGNLLPTLHRLASLIREQRIDVINIHYPTESFVYFAILRWLLGVRLVVSAHGADLFPGGRRMERYPTWLRFIVRRADAIVAPSNAFLRETRAALPSAARKAHAIHNGVDIDAFLESPGLAAPSRPYVLCIAAHNEKKALDVLLEAFAIVAASHRDVGLRLVGDGPLRRVHEARAQALGLAGEVEFLGEKGRADVVRLLHGCKYFVLPSRAEPFGMVLTEAMASRKAVVATRVGGIPEIVEDGTTGLLVETDNAAALAQAMGRLLDDGALRKSMEDAGFKRVREAFGLERMGDRYVELFLSLLRRKPEQADRKLSSG
jgi:glycosyltransferase involved in cell wall biosynthesis